MARRVSERKLRTSLESKKLDKIADDIVEIKCDISQIKEHLRGINGFVEDQKDINDTIRKKVWMAQGGIAVFGALATILTVMAFLRFI